MSVLFSWPEQGQWLIYLCFGKESSLMGSIAYFFCSLDSSFQVTVLHESTSNSTFLVVQTICELSNIITWRLINTWQFKCFVFSHPGQYLPCATPEQEPPLFSQADTLPAAGLSDATALWSLPPRFWMCMWSLRVADRLNCCALSNTSNLPSQGRRALVHILWHVTKQHINSYKCDQIWNLSSMCYSCMGVLMIS